MYRRAHSELGADHSEIFDAVSGAMTKFLERCYKGEITDAGVASLLLAFVRGECTAIHRRENRSSPDIIEVDGAALSRTETVQDTNPCHNPVQFQENTVFRGELMKCLQELSKTLRDVFLRYLDELAYAEIAAEMGILIGTVKSRIYSARRQVRSCMEAKGYMR